MLPVSDYHKDVNPRYEMTKVRPPSEIIELNRWIEALCKQRRYPYLNYFSKMVDQAGYMRQNWPTIGLHPNSAGYRAMGPLALETIDKLVARPAGCAASATRCNYFEKVSAEASRQARANAGCSHFR